MTATNQALTRSESMLLADLTRAPQHFQLCDRKAQRGLIRKGLAVLGADLYVRAVAS